MAKFTAVITDKVGLHARPASELARAASQFKSTNITIAAGDKKTDLKSLMTVLAMAIRTGTEVTIEAVGDEAEQAIKAIKKAMVESALIEG